MKKFLKPINDDPYCNDFHEVNFAECDGYSVGERLLDGVMFIISIVENKFKAEIRPDYAEYFSKLNEQKWLLAIEDYCNQLDLFNDDIICYDDKLSFDQQSFYCTKKPNIVPYVSE